jgi:cytoskeletal protein CcmA (bactofilin family)
MAKSRPSAPSDGADQHNIIGASTTLEGTLRARGNVNVAGTVTGAVEVDGRTVVAAGGLVDGEVVSTSAEIAGTVKGHVTVRERLVLKADAVVEGDIRTDKLIVEDGATFNGRCEMGAADRPAGRPATPPDRLADLPGEPDAEALAEGAA